MKITRVEVRILGPDESRGSGYRRNPVICRIYTDEGIYGDGEAATLTGIAVWTSFDMIQSFGYQILGMDPLDTELIWNKLVYENKTSSNAGAYFYAPLAAIDMALWDIKGKYFNVPVYKLLGGKQRDTLRCYASMFNVGWGKEYVKPAHSTQDFVDRALAAVAEGFTALKADFTMQGPEGKTITREDRSGLADKSFLDMAEERVAAVRDAIGTDIQLMIDGHGVADAGVAAQLLERISKYDILFFEEPTMPYLPVCERFIKNAPMHVAGGERLYSRADFYPYMKANAYDYYQPDIGRCGGITEIKKIIDMADMFDFPVMLHCNCSPIAVAAAVQIEAAMNRFAIHEHTKMTAMPTLRKLAKYDDLQPINGFITIPDRPGLGNELTEEAMAENIKYAVEEL